MQIKSIILSVAALAVVSAVPVNYPPTDATIAQDTSGAASPKVHDFDTCAVIISDYDKSLKADKSFIPSGGKTDLNNCMACYSRGMPKCQTKSPNDKSYSISELPEDVKVCYRESFENCDPTDGLGGWSSNV